MPTFIHLYIYAWSSAFHRLSKDSNTKNFVLNDILKLLSLEHVTVGQAGAWKEPWEARRVPDALLDLV